MPKAKSGRSRGRPTYPGKGKPSRKGKALLLPLTQGQEEFIQNWMVRHNATRAYQDAYPNASLSTAQTEGSRLLADPRIAHELKRLLAAERKRKRISAERVLDELAGIGFSALSDVYTKSGTIIAPADMPREIGVAVKKIKRREIMGLDSDGNPTVIGHTVELEMHDKVAALTKIGTHLNLFVEQVNHTADDAILAAIREGRARALAA